MELLRAALFLILLIILVLELVAVARSFAASRWRSTLGNLTHWDMGYDADAEHTRFILRALTYSYRVGERDYESSRLGFGFSRYMDALHLRNHLDDIFRSAPKVVVFYDPNDPTRSALSVGIRLNQVIAILGVVFCILLVIVMR